jgi:probable phosphoglycerate mutase
MRLHIVRHGQTDWNAVRRIQGQLESKLDDTGRPQARERGEDFLGMNLSAVYSSSSVRTRQTTELILGTRDDLVTFRDDLREVRLGIWQGRMWADVENAYPELVEAHRIASPAFEVEGAEKSHEVQARGVKAIESIISAHRGAAENANILIVSHGAIMKTILAHYANVALSTIHNLPSLPNCAHCIIRADRRGRAVEQIASIPFNETPWANAPAQAPRSTIDLNAGPHA